MSLKPYLEYKSSDFDWLGKLPAHWQVLRIKFLSGDVQSPVQTGPFGAQLHAEDYQDDGIPLILIRNVRNNKIDDTNIPRISEEDALRLSIYQLKQGDIVFSRVGSIGRIALITSREENWLISGQMLRLRLGSPLLFSNYLVHALSSEAILTYAQLVSVGSTRESINTDILGNTPLPVPPLSEQQAIADFLDQKIAVIDTLIAKKRELIERLQEKRTALISRAVTKGLDPSVPMKDSGVEWLGEIPAHWEAVRLKFLSMQPLQYGANESATIENPDWPRYIRITDIQSDGMLNPETFRSLPEEIAMPYLLKNGDILMARSGATVGKTFQYKDSWGRACFAGYLILCRPNLEIVSSDYLYLFTQSTSYISWKDSVYIRATIQNISAEKYNNLIVSLPPRNEQDKIVEWLSSRTQALDELILKVQRAIDRLQEYRTALISAAVTGKIDVRRSNK